MSSATTRGIRVDVTPMYLEARSDPTQHRWMYAYHVTITNLGTATVQLRTRHWIITNAMGQVEHVKGPGVVGEQPTLEPGEAFEYTSGCPMDTSMGTMHGSYQMEAEDGEEFDVEIAPFTLAEPGSIN
jgi:ApaG protein